MDGLRVDEVSVRFGGVMALDRVSLDAPPGRITGLIGPNGAGKTTLFNVVCGLQRPIAGHVVVAGRDITGASPHVRARRGVARTFQRLELFGSLTVRENVEAAVSMVTRRPRPDAADQLLARVGLLAWADSPAAALPTGRGRLLDLARALASSPKVLLLDEPASGQDEPERASLATLVRDIADDGTAVLLVEHDIDLVMSMCEHVYVLDLGRVLASGPPAAVRANHDVVAAYLGTGFAR